ncbi:hypothetical protein K501DRAFT_303233 [Backusella circina FSU 941]|nr:hypothetical protein K501DRAFT_303233 [Backusella circina FSU 941]
MSVLATSKKAELSPYFGYKYYLEYINEQSQHIRNNSTFTQDQINRLIHPIVVDKMALKKASVKANMCMHTAGRYYGEHLNDPNRSIPTPKFRGRIHRSYTHEKVKKLVEYIDNDKMTIATASIKVNMSLDSAKRYYMRYSNDPNHHIPNPQAKSGPRRSCTLEQIKQVISYVTDDKLTLKHAAKLANISSTTARKYFRAYCLSQ